MKATSNDKSFYLFFFQSMTFFSIISMIKVKKQNLLGFFQFTPLFIRGDYCINFFSLIVARNLVHVVVREVIKSLEDVMRSRMYQLVLFLEPIWLRGSVHVSCGFILQAVWLINKRLLLFMGPTVCCVWNARKRKAARSCFLCVKMLNRALLFSEQWMHDSTIHVNSFFLRKISVVNRFHLHCSRERKQQFFFIFFKN
jgi:hypothetical protein